MFVRQSQSTTYRLKLIRTRRVLSASHCRCQVITYDDGDVCIFINCIKQPRHSRMCECGIADNRYSRPLPGISRTFGHTYGSAHVHTTMDCLKWGQKAQSIATDITENTSLRIIFQDLIHCGINITVSATFTQLRRACCHILTFFKTLRSRQAESFLHRVRSKLSRTGQLSCKFTFQCRITRHDATCYILNERLSLLCNKHRVALCRHLSHKSFWQRIMRNFQYRERATLRITFVQIIESDTTCHDTHAMVCGINIFIVFRFYRILFQFGLLIANYDITFARICRKQNPVSCFRIIIYLVFLTWGLNNIYDSSGVRKTCHGTQEYWQMYLLRIFESINRHIISLLLVAWLKDRYHSKFAIEAAVLLILRRVH